MRNELDNMNIIKRNKRMKLVSLVLYWIVNFGIFDVSLCFLLAFAEGQSYIWVFNPISVY